MTDGRYFRDGRRLLRELLPWARGELRKGGHGVEVQSALGKATATYVTEANLDALIIHPAPKGGWHADVVFKRVPPGVPNTMGTPVEHPCRTREEAEEVGRNLLVAILGIAAANEAAKPAPPVFMLDRWSIELRPEIFEIALAVMPEYSKGYGSPLQAATRVEAILDELCPEGFDGKAFGDWPMEKQVRLLSVLHQAALSGLYAWPWRRDAAPDDKGPYRDKNPD